MSGGGAEGAELILRLVRGLAQSAGTVFSVCGWGASALYLRPGRSAGKCSCLTSPADISGPECVIFLQSFVCESGNRTPPLMLNHTHQETKGMYAFF